MKTSSLQCEKGRTTSFFFIYKARICFYQNTWITGYKSFRPKLPICPKFNFFCEIANMPFFLFVLSQYLSWCKILMAHLAQTGKFQTYHSCPLYIIPGHTTKFQIKNKPGDIVLLFFTKNQNHILCSSSDFASLWVIFFPYTPLVAQKMKIFEK